MVEKNSLIEWRPLVVGLAVILAIYIILATANQGGQNALFGFLLGGIVLGFILNKKIHGVAVNGIILGIIAGIITSVILVIQIYTSDLASMLNTTQIIVPVAILILYDVIATLAGTILGKFVREEYEGSRD